MAHSGTRRHLGQFYTGQQVTLAMRRTQRSQLTCVDDYRRLARRRLPKFVFDYIEGGAGDERSASRNMEAFQLVDFVPRVFQGAVDRSLQTNLLGSVVSMPLVLAPTGLTRLISRAGELDVARAAASAGVVYTLSTASSYSIEAVAEASTGPKWFQLYLWRDRHLVQSFIERARAAGYTALCITADVPVVGHRERDTKNGMTIPPTLRIGSIIDAARRPRWALEYLRPPALTFANLVGSNKSGADEAVTLGSFATRMLDPGETWAGIQWLRGKWDGPLIIKGILSPDDARRAVDFGADGIVVSNHGGRQLDGAVSSIEILPQIVGSVPSSFEVHLDGGVRRGGDVLKAIALGAKACWIGRPYLYGLAARRGHGVREVLELFAAEMNRDIALLGCRAPKELSRTQLRTRFDSDPTSAEFHTPTSEST
jgi:L-lactate dehydrogenase (cytochrome)